MADEAIHRMDTTPPPEGEDDAYSAATKIGPMARGLVEALMAKAQAEENSSMPPPVSTTQRLSMPRPGRLPTTSGVVARLPPPALHRAYDEVDDGDILDPTALFGQTGDPALAYRGLPPPSGARSVIDQLAAGRAPARPLRSDADWTKAPTLLELSVVALPTAPLAPLLEPAPIARRTSTVAAEIAVFVGAFLLVAVPAVLAYLRWFR